MLPYGCMALYTLYVYIERINLYALYGYIEHINSYVSYGYINLYVYITAINNLKQCLRHKQTGIAIIFISIAFPAHIVIAHTPADKATCKQVLRILVCCLFAIP